MRLSNPWETQVLPAFEQRTAEVASRPASAPAPNVGAPAPKVGAPAPNVGTLASAERWLRAGMPIVVPTETVYGLAACASDAEAVARVFAIKGRPADNPLIAHVASTAAAQALAAAWSRRAQALAERFWPGPLTLVVGAREPMPWLSAGLDSIALRMPAHAFTRALIERVGPLAAPSANLSGRPSPTEARHALADLAGAVPLVVDGGELEHGLESTVVDVRGERAVLLRPGAVTLEALEACLAEPVALPGEDEPVRSPGMKYRHYSPRAELWVYPAAPDFDAARRLLAADAARLQASGRRVVVIASEPSGSVRSIALPADPAAVARSLFGWLRRADELGADAILIQGVACEGIGRAVMDRLLRAASVVRDARREASGNRT